MQSLFFIIQMACQESTPIESRPESPLPQKDEIPQKVETKVTGVPVWTASVEEKSTEMEHHTPILLAGSGTGHLLYAYPKGWKIDDGPMQSIEHWPLYIAWSHTKDAVGILMRVGADYVLHIHDAQTYKKKRDFRFSMPESDTRRTYATSAPLYLVHIPQEGGWMVSSSYGLFAIEDSGLKKLSHKRMFPDLHGVSSIARTSKMISDIEGVSSCSFPNDIVWSSRWNTMVMHCSPQGENVLRWIDLSTKSVLRTLELGADVSSVSFLDERTVVAMERDMLVRWSAQGHTRELLNEQRTGTCSAYLLASQVMEVLAISNENPKNMWVIGPAIGRRFQNTHWKFVRVDMQMCSMEVKDIRGQLALNTSPIWLEKQRSFLAEINDKKRYGPALIDVDAPASWTYLFEEDVDPGLYKISGDVLGIGTYEWTRIFSLKEKELQKISELFPADDLLICPNTISRLRYRFHQWVVHDMEGTVVGVVDGAKKDISCPTPP